MIHMILNLRAWIWDTAAYLKPAATNPGTPATDSRTIRRHSIEFTLGSEALYPVMKLKAWYNPYIYSNIDVSCEMVNDWLKNDHLLTSLFMIWSDQVLGSCLYKVHIASSNSSFDHIWFCCLPVWSAAFISSAASAAILSTQLNFFVPTSRGCLWADILKWV